MLSDFCYCNNTYIYEFHITQEEKTFINQHILIKFTLLSNYFKSYRVFSARVNQLYLNIFCIMFNLNLYIAIKLELSSIYVCVFLIGTNCLQIFEIHNTVFLQFKTHSFLKVRVQGQNTGESVFHSKIKDFLILSVGSVSQYVMLMLKNNATQMQRSHF